MKIKTWNFHLKRQMHHDNFPILADDWAEDEEGEEEEGEEENEEGSEMKATIKKKVPKSKEKKTLVKKAHMNIIFIGHVGEWIDENSNLDFFLE